MFAYITKNRQYHIGAWLKDYAINAKVKGFVIGVSGGIDSALTSILAAKTGFPVLCVELPIHQEASEVERSAKHIQWLKDSYPNVSSVTVDLSNVLDSFTSQLKDHEPAFIGMPMVNTRARLRMTTLYYYGALHSSLVVGTGNKVEDFGIGFYTKYGDGGVDLSPIADLLKTEVYELAKQLNINKEILEAAPTDGLWGDDRTDEDQIGASYPELEWAMKMDSEKKSATDFKGRQQEVFEIYKRLNTANQHKMIPIPVCEISDELKR